MKISRPKLSKSSIGSGSRPFGNGPGAQTTGQIRSGHFHLATNAGAPRPSFGAGPGPQGKKVARGKKLY